MGPPFAHVVEDDEALRQIYRPAHPVVQAKKIDRLDDGCRSVIAACPLVVLATADASGHCDVSPRGGPPGFVTVLDDHRLAIPDLGGNNLLDSATNLLSNPQIAMMFVLPGREETLRVEGRAWLTTDPEVLDATTPELRRPKMAIGVEVRQAFIHCAKALRRAQVWDPTTWQPDAATSAAEMLTVHTGLDATPQQVHDDLEAGYREQLASERAQPGER